MKTVLQICEQNIVQGNLDIPNQTISIKNKMAFLRF